MTQIERVLRAIRRMDIFTAADVQSATGLPRKHCSAYLCELELRGLIRR